MSNLFFFIYKSINLELHNTNNILMTIGVRMLSSGRHLGLTIRWIPATDFYANFHDKCNVWVKAKKEILFIMWVLVMGNFIADSSY